MHRVVTRVAYVVLLIALLQSQASAETLTGVVRANKPKWQFQQSLDANTVYVVAPDPESRYTLNNGKSMNDFHGFDPIGSEVTPIGKPIPTGKEGVQAPTINGGLFVLVWHKTKGLDPTMHNGWPQMIAFPKGKDFETIRVGDGGATFHCMIVDTIAGYEDNEGECRLRLAKDDGSLVRPKFPILVEKESTRWHINEDGGVSSEIDFQLGAGVGDKKYLTCLVIEFSDGTAQIQEATKTLSAHPFKDRKGTEKTDHPGIPASKIHMIRRAYVMHSIERDSSSRDWIKKLKEMLKQADVDYQELKRNGLIQDAIKLYVAG